MSTLRKLVASVPARRLISFLFVFSGITGLVYEVLWAKFLTNILGSTAQAHTAVLATFLGGLALGNSLFGSRADKARSGLELYGWLELAIAVSAGVSPLLLQGIAEGYIALSSRFPEGSAVLGALRFLAAAAVMLVPTVLMGGTLPALVRFLTRSLKQVESNVSLLYFLNSAGAVLGTLLAAFFLVPAFGLGLTVSLTALANALIGVLVLGYSRAVSASRGARAEASASADLGPEAEPYRASALQVRVVYYGIFVSGIVSLVYETAWIRLLALVLGSSTYSFALMLAAFITGITLGSYLLHRGLFARFPAYALFGAAELVVALSIALTLPAYERLPYLFNQVSGIFVRSESTFLLHEASKLAICFALMLAPTVLLGMTLPLATRLVTSSQARVAWSVGSIFSANTVGNVIGAVLGGLVLLPWLGIHGTIVAGLAINLALAVAIFATWKEASLRLRAVNATIAALIAVLVAATPSWDMRYMATGVFRQRTPYSGFAEMQANAEQREVLFQKEDSHCSVMVYKTKDLVTLSVNGKADASSDGDLNTQTLSAHVPLLLHARPEKALIVGMGSGITAGSALLHGLERVDMVEISEAVAEGSRHFGPWNYGVHDNPRFRLHLEDAKTFLRRTPDRYDVIISEPSNPWIAGIGNLFSLQFYQEAASKLAEGGLMVQWFHNYEMTDDVFKMILRTYARVYPHVSVWNPGPQDVLLIGSLQPIEMDFGRIARRMGIPEIRADLARIGIGSLPTLLSLNIADRDRIGEIAGDGLVNDDLFPTLEYEAPKAFYLGRQSTILPLLDRRFHAGEQESLALSRYLGTRGFDALRESELAELHDFHAKNTPGLAPRILEAWLQHAPSSRESRWRAAKQHYGRGDWEGARAELAKLSKADPAEPRYLDMSAEIALRKASAAAVFSETPDIRESIAGYERLLRLQPGEGAYIHMKIGAAQEIAGNARAALTHYEKALATKPGRMPVRADSLLVSAGRVALELGEAAKAEDYARRALKANPRSKEAAHLLESARSGARERVGSL